MPVPFQRKCLGEQGFTLVELMIALAMSGILVAAVYAAYNVQQRSYYTQDQVVETQQNLRAAIELIASDIRMAKYDPDGDANADIVTATPSRLQVQMDLNNDGDVVDANEDVTFVINDDANSDGFSDSGSGNLTRNGQAIAENINAIQFHYILNDGNNVSTPTAAQRKDIASVQISVLARTEMQDAKYTNAEVYTPASGVAWAAFNDHFRRRLLITTVNLRNQGLN